MPFIGNSVQNQGFAPAVDYFNGDGTTVTFTLSRPVASVAQLTAVIENVIQNPATAFTVSGNQITFTSAPPAGTNNVWVEYTSLITQYNGISQDPSVVGDITASGGYLATGDFGNSYIDGTIVDYVTGNARITTGPIDDMTFYHGGTSSRQEMMSLYYAGGAKIFGTTALTIPVGTTAQRPGTPATGMIRMNSTTGQPEWYDNTSGTWIQFNQVSSYSISYAMLGGGGGATGGTSGVNYGAAGAAGVYRSGTATFLLGQVYTVTVGAGGAGVSSGTPGSATNSSISGVGISATATFGQGVASTSFAGGNNADFSGTSNPSGGTSSGAGAGAGGNASGLNGGTGATVTITGSSQTLGGGGGGTTGSTTGSGGAGGGGNGSNSSSGGNGQANTGSGAGASPSSGYASGGSGVVFLSIPTSTYTGVTTGSPTVTTNGIYTILKFTSSGTYTA